MAEALDYGSDAGTEEWRQIDPESEDIQIDEYDLTTSPNDFNVLTIYNFINSGSVIIPGFNETMCGIGSAHLG